jgi:hypothetical protein
MWDSAISREKHRDELGSQFCGKVEFQDSDGNIFENRAVLDWNTFRNTMQVADKPDESDKALAKQLSAIAAVLKGYQDEHGGVWTYSVPADQERRYLEQRAAEAKAAHDHIMAELQRGQKRHQQTEPPESQ